MIWLGKIPYELALWFFQIPMTILLLYGNKFSCLFWSFLLHWIQSAVLLFCHCSVTQSCPTLSDPMDCSRPGFCVFYHLLDVVQTHVHLVGDAIQPSQPLLSPSPPNFNLSQSGSFLMSKFFASGGKSIGASASASVLPMNIQDWFSLGLTVLISLHPKGLSTVFSNTTVQKHQFFGAQFFYSPTHIHTQILEKP